MPLKDLPLLLCDIYESSVAYSVTEYSRKLLVQEPILETTNCGADMADILSLDLDGSIRTCPHAGEKYIHGAVNNLKGVRVVSLNLTRNEGHCDSCVNVKLCRSSCPLNLPDETFLTNCRVEKVWYGELQKAAFRFIFGQQITSMEAVTA
jgi:radical SAM protein with 4Fe4S-binding SPASM domain